MTDNTKGCAVVVGVGPGLGAALGQRFAAGGYRVALAARTRSKVEALAKDIFGAQPFAVDATDEAAVRDLFANVEADLGPIEVAIFNASGRVRKSVLDIEVDEFRAAWLSACFGGFLVGREAARIMAPLGRGTILLTGATSSAKGFAGSAGFAVGKLGLRALAQTMARELHPKSIHVCHVVIDGGIDLDSGEARLAPDAIAGELLSPARAGEERLDPRAGGPSLGREVLIGGPGQ